MSTTEVIFSRKSIRSYTGEMISDKELHAILKAGMAAPVGMKQYETVHVTVISDPEMLTKIENEAAKSMGNPGMKCFYNAPMYVLVSVKVNKTMPTVAHSNAAMNAQNMLLAATELGIGACCIWGPVIALPRLPELMNELQIPEGFVPSAGIVLGKTNDTYEQREIPDDRIAVTEIR